GTVVGLGEAVVLLIAGIGLLSMRRWARTLTLFACVIAIASTLFQAIYQGVLVMPAMSRAFQVALPAALPQAGGPQGAEVLKFMQMFMTVITVSTVILFAILIVYLLIIVYLLCRRHVRAAFAGEGFAGEGQAGLDDRPIDDEGRSRGDVYNRDWDEDRPPDAPKDDWRIR